jgi:hypothetical protein
LFHFYPYLYGSLNTNKMTQFTEVFHWISIQVIYSLINQRAMQVITLFELLIISVVSILVYALIKTTYEHIKNK